MEDKAQLAALGAHLRDTAPIRLPLSDWRDAQARALAIHDPTLRAREALRLVDEVLRRLEEMRP